jgi:predicted SprT family Zn-dependent metalloprotease
MKTNSVPTNDTYAALQKAYDHFNRELFGGELPPCLITLQRQRGAYGYFSGDRFQERTGSGTTDEIAMNPNHIGGRSAEATLSTLAHEMAHLWQHHHGKPSRTGYHNAEWARKMREIGLIPTATGAPGGKETGQKVTHMIEGGGAFARSCAALVASGVAVNWHDPHADSEAAKKKRNTRAKFTCPTCGLNAWAKPQAALICGDCDERMSEEAPEDET